MIWSKYVTYPKTSRRISGELFRWENNRTAESGWISIYITTTQIKHNTEKEGSQGCNKLFCDKNNDCFQFCSLFTAPLLLSNFPQEIRLKVYKVYTVTTCRILDWISITHRNQTLCFRVPLFYFCVMMFDWQVMLRKFCLSASLEYKWIKPHEKHTFQQMGKLQFSLSHNVGSPSLQGKTSSSISNIQTWIIQTWRRQL